MTARSPMSLRWILAAAFSCYLVAAAVAPPGVTIIDEIQYFTEARALHDGRPLGRAGSYLLDNGAIPFAGPRYPPAWPAVLAPFSKLAWPWPFAANALVQIAGALLFAALLRRRELDPRWSLLYFAQPTLLAFSHTLMAEPLAALQTILLLLLMELDAPFWVGLVAGLAPLLKLSQLLVAAPMCVAWILRRRSPRALLLAAVGAIPPLAAYLIFNERAYGQLLAMEGSPTYAAPEQAAVFLALGLAQLMVAWPLLPLGLLRARAEEAAGALAVILYLAVYGYHYRGPNLAATLVLGARLHASAIVLLLPGYAALLSELPGRARKASLVLLGIGALLLPALIFQGIHRRGLAIERLRSATLAQLRPGCLLGYSPFAEKLLLPPPPGKLLVGAGEVERLGRALEKGLCVDLISPATEPSTYQNPPTGPDYFQGLRASFPNCTIVAEGAEPVVWLGPAGSVVACPPTDR